VTRTKNNTLAVAAGGAPDTNSPRQCESTPAGRASLAQFGAHTASFVSQVLSADWSCFYQLDEQRQPFGFQVHRTPWALREAYLKHDMARTDPLHPSSLAVQNIRFLSMFDSRLSGPLDSRRHFWNFLSTFGTRDAAEMIFRVRGRAVAGLSLIWVGNSGTRAEREQGEAVHSYVEFNLASHASQPRPVDAHDTDTRLGLTRRELEIARLICDGLTNVQIARRLNIGASTVKTHLLHVFEKLGIQTRAALVTCLLSATHRPDA
jgi:DNA-binding CsgD family transcriptional regulator